ncbi:DUF6284 family protein [Micromonospora inyonensis]|uniref:Uncharacterized protein n=1 Tax=Micromonospora inyonensis TaxID=47866 RepID=A0A1C6RDC6_9ACTN|nr:DUF6284 family protein [Micromonospora inyonensis]SCL15151.1 hypothetical protein GA0074694_1076 [Micromonospora inyonensis]
MRKRLVPFAIEPTAADLAAIEVEWPLIAAELDLLDAEITLLNAVDHGGPSPLDWRRVRRAAARVTRTAADLGRHTPVTSRHAA